MSVIVSRALPDVRDGLKPVHRRILYAQHDLGNEYNKSYKKSARIVGDVIGKYHPHGDNAVYDALVRMAQDFSMRLPLEDGQGNFGSMDGDNAAAMRYTEVRMAKVATAMLADIDKDTVDFAPNYDGNEMEPTVLPSRFPNILVNGAAGIAVGMATNIPPHNLGEVIDATIALVETPALDNNALNEIVLGPDFPTGGQIMGRGGIISGNATGRGSITVRGKHKIEKVTDSKEAIILTELPYQVNKAKLVERIGELVREKVIEDISELRDESDKHGVRVYIELKRGANADVLLNQLYKATPLQSSFSYNMLALDQGRPRLMGIREILKCFIAHREEVITRRTRFELGKARDRAHILAGLATAVANIDEIIRIIRNAPDAQVAKEALQAQPWPAADVAPLIQLLGETMTNGTHYQLSARQAQAILELRLHRLTGLEREKIVEEATEIQAVIQELVNILNNRSVLLDLLKAELLDVKEQFATPRRTEITASSADVSLEDLIDPEDVVVTISSDGYVKRLPMDTFRAQRRGGKGKSMANLKDDEQITRLFMANTHDLMLFFSSFGKVYKLKVYELPQASAQSRGKAFINLLPLEKGEMVQSVVPIPADQEQWGEQSIIFATRQGMVRRTPLISFANVRSNGIHGMGLNDGDELVDAQLCKWAAGEVILSSRHGYAARFDLQEHLRPITSRTSAGVRGMKLRHGDTVMSMYVIPPANAAEQDTYAYLLSVSSKGYGKLTPIEDYPAKGRPSMGVVASKTSKRNGDVVAVVPVRLEDEIMIATGDGQLIRTKVSGISVMGRNTMGVRLFDVGTSEVALVSRILTTDEEGDAPDAEGADAEVLSLEGLTLPVKPGADA